jgi:inorganic triphosphatase YgiF
MAREIELKLEVPSDALAEVGRAAWLRERAAGPNRLPPR